MALPLIIVVHSNIVIVHRMRINASICIEFLRRHDSLVLSQFLNDLQRSSYTQLGRKYIHYYLFHHFQALSPCTHITTPHPMHSISFGIKLMLACVCKQFEKSIWWWCEVDWTQAWWIRIAKNFSTRKSKIIIIIHFIVRVADKYDNAPVAVVNPMHACSRPHPQISCEITVYFIITFHLINFACLWPDRKHTHTRRNTVAA